LDFVTDKLMRGEKHDPVPTLHVDKRRVHASTYAASASSLEHRRSILSHGRTRELDCIEPYFPTAVEGARICRGMNYRGCGFNSSDRTGKRITETEFRGSYIGRRPWYMVYPARLKAVLQTLHVRRYYSAAR
jgi:hypothetical protein